MSEAEFRAKRRQKFLTEKYYKLNRSALNHLLRSGEQAIEERRDDPQYVSSMFGGAVEDKLKLLHLHYTAGEPVEALRPLYADVMHWFAEWHRAHEAYRASIAREDGEDLRIDVTPIKFNDLFHFQLAIEVISLGVLLGEGERVREAGRWLRFERERGDMLVEYLLGAATPQDELVDCDEFFHVKPYDPLLDAVYTADTADESAAFVKKYLEGWYKAFDGVPWHDGHLVQNEEYSNYEGYWSFEAAAICVIHGIDDTSFCDHIVYPKDLADWAREHKVLDLVKPTAGMGALASRVDAGQPCPRSGYWFTTAKQGSRKAFKVGEMMQAIKDSHWGATIWYWDARQ